MSTPPSAAPTKSLRSSVPSVNSQRPIRNSSPALNDDHVPPHHHHHHHHHHPPGSYTDTAPASSIQSMEAFALPPPSLVRPRGRSALPHVQHHNAPARPAMTVAQPRPAHLASAFPEPSSRPAPPPAPAAAAAAPPAAPAPAPVQEPITIIDGVEEYLQMLREHSDSLIVLKIFAPWCRSCRGLQPKVARLAREFEEVKFFKMDFEKNRDLCYRLGVSAMPTFIFYHGSAGEIDKFSCGPLRGGIIREKIEQVLEGQCLYDPSENL